MSKTLVPLFESQNQEEHILTISKNISLVLGSIWTTKELNKDKYIKLLEFGILLDSDKRDDMMNFIRDFNYLSERLLEGHTLLSNVQKQINTLISDKESK